MKGIKLKKITVGDVRTMVFPTEKKYVFTNSGDYGDYFTNQVKLNKKRISGFYFSVETQDFRFVDGENIHWKYCYEVVEKELIVKCDRIHRPRFCVYRFGGDAPWNWYDNYISALEVVNPKCRDNPNDKFFIAQLISKHYADVE